MNSPLHHSSRFQPETDIDNNRLSGGFLDRNRYKIIAGLILAAALALALSLMTWSIYDPSLTHAVKRIPINALGFPGAALSDLLIQVFGLAAMMILPPMLIMAWRLYTEACPPTFKDYIHSFAFISASILFMACLPVFEGWPLPTSHGGIAGDGLYRIISSPFNTLLGGGTPTALGFIALIVMITQLRDLLAWQYKTDARTATYNDRDQEAQEGEATFNEPLGVITMGALMHLYFRLKSYFVASPSHYHHSNRHSPESWEKYAMPDHAPVADAYQGGLGGWQQAFNDYTTKTPSERPVQPVYPEKADSAPSMPLSVKRCPPAFVMPNVAQPTQPDVQRSQDFAVEATHMAPSHVNHTMSPTGRLEATAPARDIGMFTPIESPMESVPLSVKPNQFNGQEARQNTEIEPGFDSIRSEKTLGYFDTPSPEIQPFEATFSALTDANTGFNQGFAASPNAMNHLEADDFSEMANINRHTRSALMADSVDDMPEIRQPAPVAAPAYTKAPAHHVADAPAPVSHDHYESRDTESHSYSGTEVSLVADNSAPKPRTATSRKKLPQQTEAETFDLPPLDMLQHPQDMSAFRLGPEELKVNATELEQVLGDFGVRGDIIKAKPGPVVTLYELEPAPGIKSSRVIGLADDIARSMSAVSARVAVVPGRNVIGIELPNAKRETVVLREMLEGGIYKETPANLPVCLGKTIGGEPVVADLAKMPHLLIAGTTGSGKSVAINTMILSLLYKLTPEQCRLIMIDPKMLELSIYDDIPHLLTPVVTDPKKAVLALKWTVREMEERYRKMSKLGVRNIEGYNRRVSESIKQGKAVVRTVQTGFNQSTGEAVFERQEMKLEPLPFIVVIVDEMADLMMVAGKEIEGAVQRLAQMARAAGIHIVMATQRPSVDVITGTIKANFPTRISFQVTSRIDSRTILGDHGAEQLLGQGDMLYMAGGGRTVRLHGPFVKDEEVEAVVSHLKMQGAPDYLTTVTDETEDDEDPSKQGVSPVSESLDGGDLYDQAVAIVLRDKKASTSYVQRRLSIGYNRAASLIERMEKEGIVSPANHAGKREILVESPEPQTGL